jgi:hypothetical protein
MEETAEFDHLLKLLLVGDSGATSTAGRWGCGGA